MINLDNKKFKLLENADVGEVIGDTVFHIHQKGNIARAEYYGGSIASGHILAWMDGETMEMSYHCITQENKIKVGKALAKVSIDSSCKIHLMLEWEWISGAEGKGSSHYLEIV
ncbi:MAG: hypothetical protein ACJA08_002854 [Cyclobacteriaceae bacterium]|jgi:hypothetical protein